MTTAMIPMPLSLLAVEQQTVHSTGPSWETMFVLLVSTVDSLLFIV